MRVFLSWSGERSRRVAAALRKWLPATLNAINPWMSEVDILPGGVFRSDIEKAIA
jgi:hypothetical protein